MTTFRAIFIAVVIAAVLLVGAFLVHQRRPGVEREQPTADLVRAALEAAVGVVGFALHLQPVFDGGAAPLVDRILYGAPPFAPLLFTDLALLGALAAWDLRARESLNVAR